MDCIIWLEDEEGGNEVEWSSGRKTGEHKKPVIQNSWTEQKNWHAKEQFRNNSQNWYSPFLLIKLSLGFIIWNQYYSFVFIKTFREFHCLDRNLLFVLLLVFIIISIQLLK